MVFAAGWAGPALLARELNTGAAIPWGMPSVAAFAPVLLGVLCWLIAGYVGASILTIFSGGSLPRFLFTLGLAGLPSWLAAFPADATLGDAWAGAPRQVLRAIFLATSAGLAAASCLHAFLDEATRRGARLMYPRWRSRRLPRLLAAAAVAVFAGLLFGFLPLGTDQPFIQRPAADSLPAALASLLIVLGAWPLYEMGRRLTGSAGVGWAAGFAWLAMAGQPVLPSDPGLSHAAAGLLVLVATQGELIRSRLGWALRAAWIPALLLAPGQVLPLALVHGLFVVLGQRELAPGLFMLFVGSVVMAIRAVLASDTDTPISPEMLRLIATFNQGSAGFAALIPGVLVLLLPLGALAILHPGLALALPFVLLWAAPEITPDWSSGVGGLISTPLAPAHLAWLFVASLWGLQRWIYGRPFLAGSDEDTRAIAEATPEAPPADIPSISAEEFLADRPWTAVPRPWNVHQMVRLRAAVGVLLLGPLGLYLALLLM